jgi:UDP-N-acetylmuramyl pentapeptide phosphotransferase/UDP-N-acetylglucosamine-1-phosphate transferase
MVWLIRRYAVRLSLLDIPNERSLHAVPTPRGGGLAIVIVVLLGLPALARYRGEFSARIVLVYVGAGALLAAVGWIDDRRSLSPRLRLAMHIAAAALAVMGMGFFADTRLPFVPPVLTGGSVRSAHLGWVGLPLTLLWIVGMINAYNFMDGIDGLAAGQAVIGGVFWAVVGWQSGAALAVWLGTLIASASFGFLLHNWPSARIFMGDVASGFLGFSFAVLPLMGKDGKAPETLLGVGALFVWPFIFDTTFTFLRRLRRRENVFRAHRSHLYQRLVIAGLSHATVTTLYLGLAALGGLIGVAWARAWPGAELGILLVPCAGLGLWAGVVWSERRAASATIETRRGSSSERQSRR